MHFARVLLRIAVVGLALSFPAVGQQTTSPATSCEPSWLPTFGGAPGTDGEVYALASFDDGSGPALFVAGKFGSAGGVAATNIAKWNGTSWSSVGGGTDREVWALAVFDDGTGPALYAGGRFRMAGGIAANQIARWNGATWSPVGTGLAPNVLALAVFDDGSGPALYAGGEMNGGGQGNSVAKWNGSTWSVVGGQFDAAVWTLAAFDDGSGPALYAGGLFRNVGGQAADQVAKWNGAAWSPLGSGMAGGQTTSVFSLAVFDDGGGPALYAGGDFASAGGATASSIAKWDGSAWSSLHGGVTASSFMSVTALCVFDDGNGAALYAGGVFTHAGGVAARNIARWNGTSWSRLSSGVDNGIRALTVFDDGHGAALCAGGSLTHAGGVGASHIAQWRRADGARVDGAKWSTLGRGIDGQVTALVAIDDGGGSALYAAGDFTSAGGVPANDIAKWDGTRWSALGDGIGGGTFPLVRALAVFDDGNGPELYAGGYFEKAGSTAASHIAKWNGTRWSSVGGGVAGVSAIRIGVAALAVFDDGSGPALYAGGDFMSAGGVTVNHIAKWDGTTWSALSTGVEGNSQTCVFAMTVFDDGSGPALYAGGELHSAGGIPAREIAKWSGAAWSAVGGNLQSPIYALTSFDDGNGPALHAGGAFNSAEGDPNHIAKWSGGAWSPLGNGLSNHVYALAVFDDGSGPRLYAGGAFNAGGSVPAQYIAQWNGSTWSAMGAGMGVGTNPYVLALAVLADGSGPALHAGGAFTVSPSGDSYLAKWGCTLPAGARTFGASSPGCNGPLAMSVTASPRIGATFAITGGNAPPNAAGALVLGSALAAPLAFLGTQLWVSPTLAVSVASTATGSSETALSVRADPSLVGLRFDLQLLWLGPTTPPPCPPLGLSASNALALTIQP